MDSQVAVTTNNLLYNASGLVPAMEPNPNNEVDHIRYEFGLANMVKEIGKFRIWRLKHTEKWKEITEPGTSDPKYQTWEHFIRDISDALLCKRSHLFERLRLYDQLEWIGYTDEEKIKMLSVAPSLYQRFMYLIMEWDHKDKQPMAIKIPGTNGMKDDQIRETIKHHINKIEIFDSQIDAIKYVSESILVEPQIEIRYNGDTINCVYYNQTQNKDGDTEIYDYGEVTFYPNADIPDWVSEKIAISIKKSVRVSNDGDKHSR